MSSLRFMTPRLATPLHAFLPCLVFAVPTFSAESTAVESMKPVEELVELDEVRVRGKLIANVVITAENRVFRLYNKLNSDNRYDVHCRDVRAPQGLALLRICAPEFVANNWAPAFVPTSFGWRGSRMLPQCGMSSGYDMNGNVYTSHYCGGSDFGSINSATYTSNYFGGGFSVPATPPIAASPERIEEFKQTMAKVMNSDPELYALAKELAGMYGEVERVQARYAQLQEDRRAAQRAKRAAARERGVDLWPPHPRAP